MDRAASTKRWSRRSATTDAGQARGDPVRLPPEALWRAAEQTYLFAEVDPDQKERIVLALKKMGHVVGYMGDGINDAPALHAADVGVSVEGAVDVAREAADFVLLRHDLDVLTGGILAGRATFANTLKYVLTTMELTLPFVPLAPWLGFVPLPPAMLAALLAITAAYVLATELFKLRFFAAERR